MADKRKVELKKVDGWCPIEFKDVKKDMTIRMFEPDGTPVKDHNDKIEMYCSSDAYLHLFKGDTEERWTIAVGEKDD